MEQDQRQGVTIPGYQPVEMLGNAPSYGVWVRAVQTRMDRHVLLKLLPPGLPLAHDSFSREIQTLVRLDGHGVLRVIDEGTSSGVRYLVVDEAEGRLIEDAPPAGSAGWQDLGETLEECYRRVTDLGLVMLPIPPIALRRLPAGRFALADLGWLVPARNKLPAHPSVPAELAGEPAALGMNGRFLARTLRGLPETLGRTAPRSWRRAIAALEERSDRQADDDPFAQPILRGRIEAIPSRLSAPSLGLVALLLVVAAAWATSYFIGENAGQEVEQPAAAVAEEEGANGTGSGQGTVSPVVEEIPAAPGPESETEAQGELEERAALLLAEILPEPQVPLPLPLPPEKGRRLETLRDRFRGTRAAACAERNLRAGREALAERLHALWEPLMAQISEHLSGGRLDSAESLILEGQEAVSAHSGSPVMAEVAAQVLALRRRMGAAAQVRRRALAARIEQHRAARDHGAAIAAIDAALAGLPSEERRWAEAERAALEAQGERYRGAIRALEGALAEMLLTCEDGAWDDARALLNRADPGADFPEMRGRWERWSGWLRRARAMGEGLRSALGSSGRAETPHPYRRAAGTSALRGRVLSAEPAAFTLKIHGRKNTETIPYRDLDLSSIEEIVGERRGPPGAEGPLLLLFFLGAVDRAISGARELAEAPQWLEAAITRKESDRDRSITSALDRGRKAAAAGDWAGAREVVLELGTRFPAAELTPHLEEMRRWLSGYWQERGAP
ncbi:MAG: hypothetical protein ACE5GW_03440, partial [Planctomycetota bacterium]